MRAWCKQITRTTAAALLAAAAFSASSCTEAPAKVPPKYPTLSDREVPKFLEGTIYQIADLSGTEPFPVSGYGLVTHLAGTGGSRVATPIRAYMAKELARHNFGEMASNLPTPDEVLDDPNVTIVRIDGNIPPGARAGNGWSSWFDVRVTILGDSDATSLAHGVLFQSDLKVNGANPSDPGSGMVDIKGQAAGPVFVNPAYVLESNIDTPEAHDGVHSGVVMAGARVMTDRPLILRLRVPDRRTARAVEQRIVQRFQDSVDDDLRPVYAESAASAKKVANAQDEGRVDVYVPRMYSDHWQHFASLIKYLYLQGNNPAFAAKKAEELAVAAVQPKAALDEITYCWEGLGHPALYAITPLMSSRDPAVQFAAVRAAAFIGDPGAVPILLSIATEPGNPFRVSAVEVMGELPQTPRVDRLCRILLNSDDAQVRVAAYRLLAAHDDSGTVKAKRIVNSMQEVFSLDMISSTGTPMIYATRQGVPRLAVFGDRLLVTQPLLFTTFDGKLTISCDGPDKPVKIVYYGPGVNKTVKAECGPNIDQIVDVLAGDGQIGPGYMHLGFSEICAVVQSMVDRNLITGPSPDGQMVALYQTQEPGKLIEAANNGHNLLRGNPTRPQTDRPDGSPETPVTPAGTPAPNLLRGGHPAVDGPPAPPADSGPAPR